MCANCYLIPQRASVNYVVSFYNISMEQELRRRLAYNLRVERAKRLMTQEQLAELANVSTKHITKIESGHVTPSLFLAFRLAQVLKVTIDDLIKECNIITLTK